MKYLNSFVIIFTLTRPGTFGADVLPKTCAEEQILDLLTEWRNGGVLSPLPNLNVIRIRSVEGLYEGFGIKLTFSTGDMQLTGARNFTVEDLAVSPQQMEASWTIRFPLLTLSSDQYSLKGRAYLMYTLKGAGFMNTTFENVALTLGTTLVSNGTAIQVDDVDMEFSIGNIQVDLADSSWPINKVLNKNALKIVEDNRTDLVSVAKEVLMQEINEHLATTTSSQLLGILGNGTCNYPSR